ncbi:MAG: hypothetical protein K0Q83_3404 [Deltaproteobacteria bacterium]|jgi:hypothetical protein|nr:hypothetical protein [Deltaproteobacteria bacterium]
MICALTLSGGFSRGRSFPRMFCSDDRRLAAHTRESAISKQPLDLTFASRRRALPVGDFVFPPPVPSSAITPAASS